MPNRKSQIFFSGEGVFACNMGVRHGIDEKSALRVSSPEYQESEIHHRRRMPPPPVGVY
jgi:hypothetical protein